MLTSKEKAQGHGTSCGIMSDGPNRAEGRCDNRGMDGAPSKENLERKRGESAVVKLEHHEPPTCIGRDRKFTKESITSGNCDLWSPQLVDLKKHCNGNVNETAEYRLLNPPGEISSGFRSSAELTNGSVHNRSSGQQGGDHRLSSGLTESRDQLGGKTGLSGELTEPRLSGKLAPDANQGDQRAKQENRSSGQLTVSGKEYDWMDAANQGMVGCLLKDVALVPPGADPTTPIWFDMITEAVQLGLIPDRSTGSPQQTRIDDSSVFDEVMGLMSDKRPASVASKVEVKDTERSEKPLGTNTELRDSPMVSVSDGTRAKGKSLQSDENRNESKYRSEGGPERRTRYESRRTDPYPFFRQEPNARTDTPSFSCHHTRRGDRRHHLPHDHRRAPVSTDDDVDYRGAFPSARALESLFLREQRNLDMIMALLGYGHDYVDIQTEPHLAGRDGRRTRRRRNRENRERELEYGGECRNSHGSGERCLLCSSQLTAR